jgi:hypothetical protein
MRKKGKKKKDKYIKGYGILLEIFHENVTDEKSLW